MPSPTSSPMSPSALGHNGLPDRCPIFQRTQNATQPTSPYWPGPVVANTFWFFKNWFIKLQCCLFRLCKYKYCLRMFQIFYSLKLFTHLDASTQHLMFTVHWHWCERRSLPPLIIQQRVQRVAVPFSLCFHSKNWLTDWQKPRQSMPSQTWHHLHIRRKPIHTLPFCRLQPSCRLMLLQFQHTLGYAAPEAMHP